MIFDSNKYYSLLYNKIMKSYVNSKYVINDLNKKDYKIVKTRGQEKQYAIEVSSYHLTIIC
jgi:hypothetical protein